MEFIVISDFHYGFPEDREMEEYADPYLRRFVERINEEDPEFVVCLGDMIQHSDEETDIDRMDSVREILSDIEADLWVIPGNHDVIALDPEQFMGLSGAKNSDTSFCFQDKGYNFVGIDTNSYTELGWGIMGEDERKRLRSSLSEDKTNVIFSHHLLHYRKFEGNWFFDHRPELAICVDKMLFQEIAEGYEIEMVVSGHIHESTHTEFESIDHYTLDAMDKFNPPEKLSNPIVKFCLNEDGLESHTIEI